MKQLVGSIGVGLKRAFLGGGFLGAAVGLCVLSLLSIYQEAALLGPDSSVVYLYEMGNYANFWVLFLLFGAIPGATLFCSDWENQYLRFQILRSGKVPYGVSSAIVCYLSGGAAVFLGEWLFLGVLSLRYPLFSASDVLLTGFDNTPFAPLLTSSGILLFYAARFFIKACCAGFFAVVALWFSTKITNVFVTLAVPVIFHYLWENLTIAFGLPSYLDFSRIAMGHVYLNGSLAWAVWYPVLLFTALAALFGALFTRGVERRVENG